MKRLSANGSDQVMDSRSFSLIYLLFLEIISVTEFLTTKMLLYSIVVGFFYHNCFCIFFVCVCEFIQYLLFSNLLIKQGPYVFSSVVSLQLKFV